MTDYSTLKSDLLSWSARDDLAASTASFIMVAEAFLGRRIRLLDQETDTTLTASSPDYTATLPAGFLGFKHLFVVGSSLPGTEYLPPNKFHELANSPRDGFSVLTGAKTLYTIESGKVKLLAAAGATSDVVLNATYYGRLTALSDAAPSNALLTDHYDIYLHAGLVALWTYVGSDKDVSRHVKFRDEAIEGLTEHENRRRRGVAPLAVRPPEVVF